MTGASARAAPGGLALALALLAGLAGTARAEVAVPPLTARVTDLTATLSADQARALEQTLQAFEARKGTQIAVLLVPSTQPETIEQYGIRVAEQWRLGRKNVDDGALLIVARNDRAVRIEVGYGLEGPLNDAISARIIREAIVPHFQQGDFYGGLSEGVARIIQVADGEPLPPPAGQAANRPNVVHYAPLLLILALAIGGFLRAVLGRVPGAVVTGGVLGFIAWLMAGALFVAVLAGAAGFLFTLLGGGGGGAFAGGRGGGYWGGFGGGPGGGFGGGGFGGGGFSGGGGGFGGGGASGRW